jgi:type II secretory pathway pseudopilin PulG
MPVPRQRSRRLSQGFTIIEMVVVILIVMILVGMAVPAVTAGVRSSKLREAASETATAFRRARSMAIAAGEIYSAQPAPLPGDPDRYQVTIHKARDDGTPDASFPAGGLMLPSGVKFIEEGPASLGKLIFLPDGTIAGDGFTTPNEVWIVHEDESPPYYGRPHYVISFRPLTGRIEVSELKD